MRTYQEEPYQLLRLRQLLGGQRSLQAGKQLKGVEAWAKNDHLGFELLYVYRGVVRKYRPDFLIRLKIGDYLVLETKGQDTEKDKTKQKFLEEWVQGVNEYGGFGTWKWAVSKDPGDIEEILASD
jgi:type III restriction enzyme